MKWTVSVALERTKGCTAEKRAACTYIASQTKKEKKKAGESEIGIEIERKKEREGERKIHTGDEEVIYAGISYTRDV